MTYKITLGALRVKNQWGMTERQVVGNAPRRPGNDVVAACCDECAAEEDAEGPNK